MQSLCGAAAANAADFLGRDVTKGHAGARVICVLDVFSPVLWFSWFFCVVTQTRVIYTRVMHSTCWRTTMLSRCFRRLILNLADTTLSGVSSWTSNFGRLLARSCSTFTAFALSRAIFRMFSSKCRRRLKQNRWKIQMNSRVHNQLNLRERHWQLHKLQAQVSWLSRLLEALGWHLRSTTRGATERSFILFYILNYINWRHQHLIVHTYGRQS